MSHRARSDGCVDEKTASLARLAALVALRAAPASYKRSVDTAIAAGATAEDMVDTLTAVAPTVGLARVVSAAPGLALALGYDIDRALESNDDLRDWSRVRRPSSCMRVIASLRDETPSFR